MVVAAHVARVTWTHAVVRCRELCGGAGGGGGESDEIESASGV